MFCMGDGGMEYLMVEMVHWIRRSDGIEMIWSDEWLYFITLSWCQAMVFIGLCQWWSTSISIWCFFWFIWEVSCTLMYTWILFCTLTHFILLLWFLINTNIGSVVNDEVVVMGITLEYHRSNDGGSYPKFCFCLK